MLGRWRWACGGCGVLRSRFYCNVCRPPRLSTAIPAPVLRCRNEKSPSRELHCLVDPRRFSPCSTVRTNYDTPIRSINQLARAEGKSSQSRQSSTPDIAATEHISSSPPNEDGGYTPESKLRCTELDKDGQIIVADAEFKKTGLIAKYRLLPRDLRKIDKSNLPYILVRPSTILVNLLDLRVVIKRDCVLLVNSNSTKSASLRTTFLSSFHDKIRKRSEQLSEPQPYEFEALESAFIAVVSALEEELDTIREPVSRVLSDLDAGIDRFKLRTLLLLSEKVTSVKQRARLVRDAIDELFDYSENLAAIHATETTRNLSDLRPEYTEADILLESYYVACNAIVEEAQTLATSIEITQEVIQIMLDSSRNDIMLMDMKLRIGILGMALGSLIVGFYGMNIYGFMKDSEWAFLGVSGFAALCSTVLVRYGLMTLRRLQKVKMIKPRFGPFKIR